MKTTDFAILGVVAVLGILSLIMLFTLPTPTQLSISEPYGWGQQGIAEPVKLPPYKPFSPQPQFPAAYDTKTIGTRTPFMIFFKGEYGNINEMSKCFNDLSWVMVAPQESFKCYSVPTTLPAEEVTGFFWPTSSALPKPFYQIGGDIYCYENFPYERSALFNRLKPIVEKDGWSVGKMNNEDILLCLKGETFIYPQGRYY